LRGKNNFLLSFLLSFLSFLFFLFNSRIARSDLIFFPSEIQKTLALVSALSDDHVIIGKAVDLLFPHLVSFEELSWEQELKVL